MKIFRFYIYILIFFTLIELGVHFFYCLHCPCSSKDISILAVWNFLAPAVYYVVFTCMSMNRSRSYYEILLVLEVANNKFKEMKKCFVFLHFLRERERKRDWFNLITIITDIQRLISWTSITRLLISWIKWIVKVICESQPLLYFF